MSEQSPDPIEQLAEYFHRCHGHRIALSTQYLNQGDVRKAVRAWGEANAYRSAIHVLEKTLDNGGVSLEESETGDAYATLSRTALAANDVANGNSKQSEDDSRGWH